MDLTIEEELRRIFDVAALRHEADTLRTSRQWKAAAEISVRCDTARDNERRLYAARYETRVEIARRRLINEAGEKSLEFKPPWAGEDRFSPDATLRQARRDVNARHSARLSRIDEFERRELRELITRSMRENNLQGHAREAFQRATDRRAGFDRRRSRSRDQ